METATSPAQRAKKHGTVQVEVLVDADRLAERLSRRGFEVVADGRRLLVGPGDETIETAVIEEASALGSGLVRMVRGSASLEDLFLHNEQERR
jgi:hypothetical protein